MRDVSDDPHRQQQDDERPTDEDDAPHVTGDVRVFVGRSDGDARVRSNGDIVGRPGPCTPLRVLGTALLGQIAASSSAARASSASVSVAGGVASGAAGVAVALGRVADPLGRAVDRCRGGRCPGRVVMLPLARLAMVL